MKVVQKLVWENVDSWKSCDEDQLSGGSKEKEQGNIIKHAASDKHLNLELISEF